jgi:carboxypeptidase C (cathepsin A)
MPKKAVNSRRTPRDQPLLDTTPYGYGRDDAISDSTESAAITHKQIPLNGRMLSYTAQAGHLVTTGLYSAQPVAKIFYVAFTKKGTDRSRPVTFLYNGGPGSSSVFLLLGSFGPRRIETGMPHYTWPAPYELEDNEECLLNETDLVFINPVGTAYSTAIAPKKNSEFWGVDEDAHSIKQFVKRYLTVFNRWNSPKFLFGESYGTPRTCALTWLLHEEGVDLNGIILQSSVLDYSRFGDAVGLLPTLAADWWFHDEKRPHRPDLSDLMGAVEKFARTEYAAAKATFPNVDPGVIQQLSEYIGIPPAVLKSWKLDPATPSVKLFLTSLLKGLALGAYDGRATAPSTGIAGSIRQGNDPALMAVAGVYTAMWHVYLNDELKFTSTSPFMALNDQVSTNWNLSHIDPTREQKGGQTLYTAGDLAAAMQLNPYLKVFSASGYFDAVTPYFQTILNFENMPLDSEDPARKNLEYHNYESGHMIYLDKDARSQMKTELAKFYEVALQRQKPIPIRHNTLLQRRISDIPY